WVNINYRYVEDELRYLFDNADLVALVHHREFAPRVAAVRDQLPKLRHALVIDDGSGSGADVTGLGSVDYEAALAAQSPERDFGPHRVWRLVEHERVNLIMITGDAMARPLVEALEEPGAAYDLSSLVGISSSAAVFSPSVKEQLFEHLPNLVMTDAIGSSESGSNGLVMVQPGKTAMKGGPTVTPVPGTIVLDDDLRPVAPGSGV